MKKRLRTKNCIKSTDKVESKFKKGDWITCEELNTAKISNIDIDIDRYEVEFINGSKGFPHIDYIDRNFHLWTIQDAKNGDVLHSPSHHLIWIYKDNEHYHVCINMNYVIENVAIDGLIVIPNDACPATKDEQTILFEMIEKSGYEWVTDKKELQKEVIK